ncbi:hypothetical protein L5515_010412 [Caenorhabditis briggsae]|uniref:Uncharacterized protein n=1 Tax=Caenorhabditis briggsae TaxID=6238 RepID=A0AAE9EM04_CAEBR|nr:hypothetical protein L5515_010412 [Caenorhabditis briggsae]
MNNDWSTFEHPVFRSARCVFIGNEENNQPELFRRLLGLPNENITVQSRLSWRTFQTITENWRRTQRKVGRTLIIKRVHTKDVENILNQILQEWQHRENKNEDFIVHLYQDKNLRISSGDTHEELPRNPRLTSSSSSSTSSSPVICQSYHVAKRNLTVLTMPINPSYRKIHIFQMPTTAIFAELDFYKWLTVKHRDREYVERVPKNEHSLFSFSHYINNLLLRGSEPIRMKRLEINVAFLRLPGSVKYHSKEVDFRVTGFGFDLLKKILDVSSFPLNFYGIGYISEDWTTFEHPVFRSARNIFISNKENNQPELFRSLLKLPNKSIKVQSRLPWITFQTITDNWKTTQRKVGTSLTIERVHTEDVDLIKLW